MGSAGLDAWVSAGAIANAASAGYSGISEGKPGHSCGSACATASGSRKVALPSCRPELLPTRQTSVAKLRIMRCAEESAGGA